MNLFGLTVYTKQNSLGGFGEIVQSEIAAQKLIEGKKVISAGSIKERINFLNQNDLCYALAIQVLSQQEQDKVKAQGHAGWAWFKWLFWKPLEIEINEKKIIVLVNINSAVKRLKGLGFTPKQVKDHLDKRTLIQESRKAFQQKWQKEIESRMTTALEASSIHQSLYIKIKEHILNHIETRQIHPKDIEALIHSSNEIKIEEEKDISQLEDYFSFKKGVEAFLLQQSSLSSEETSSFLTLFNQVNEWKKSHHFSSFSKVIADFWNRIHNIMDIRKCSFVEACSKYRKKQD